MILKEINYKHPTDYENATHENIPGEELWEDGELSPGEVQYKIIKNVLEIGDWILVRRINE